MGNQTYDVSAPSQHWFNQEVVGEYYYSKHILDLKSAHSVEDKGEVLFTAELIPEPDNPHSEQRHAISVRWKNRVIGYLPEKDAAHYQQLRRIVASGFTPIARAYLRFYKDYIGNWDFDIRLSLQDSNLLIPLNEPPYDGWTLLPYGSTVQVTKESDHFDILLDYVPPSGTGQLLVSLHLFTAGVRTKYEAVEVRLDGERIGELSKQMSGKYAVAVRHFEDMGLTTFSRATIKGSSLSAEVTLQSAKAHELSEEDLDPEIAPLPRLVPYCADPTEYIVPDAYVGKNAQLPQKEEDPDWDEIDWRDDEDEITPVEDQNSSINQALHYAEETIKTPPQPDQQSQPEYSTPLPIHKVKENDLTSEKNDAATTNTHQKYTKKNNTFLWVGVVFAIMCIIAGLGSFTDSVALAFGYIMAGAGIALACGWPLYCRYEDKKALLQWKQEKATNRDLENYLTDEDRALLNGISINNPPAPVSRRWKIVGPVAAVLIIAGFSMSSSSMPESNSTSGTEIGTTP